MRRTEIRISAQCPQFHSSVHTMTGSYICPASSVHDPHFELRALWVGERSALADTDAVQRTSWAGGFELCSTICSQEEMVAC